MNHLDYMKLLISLQGNSNNWRVKVEGKAELLFKNHYSQIRLVILMEKSRIGQ